MRIFIVADVHGNLPALEAVLADLARYRPRWNSADPQADRLICLGDIIGYYAYPNEVMDRIWDLTEEVLLGNHELSVHAFMESPGQSEALTWGVHPHASWAFQWTARILNQRNRLRLENLLRRRHFLLADFSHRALFAHAAPSLPEEMDYITSAIDSYARFFEPPECRFFHWAFIGHSHVPQVYRFEPSADAPAPWVDGGVVLFREPGTLSPDDMALPPEAKALLLCEGTEEQRFEKTWRLNQDQRMLVSVPSVGQPRDGLPLAGYAVFDPDQRAVTMVRVPYNIASAVEAMRNLAGCPATLIERLRRGR